MSKQVAIYYQSAKYIPGGGQVVVLAGNKVSYVRAELAPEDTSLEEALGRAKPRKGENVMNSHYI